MDLKTKLTLALGLIVQILRPILHLPTDIEQKLTPLLDGILFIIAWLARNKLVYTGFSWTKAFSFLGILGAGFGLFFNVPPELHAAFVGIMGSLSYLVMFFLGKAGLQSYKTMPPPPQE